MSHRTYYPHLRTIPSTTTSTERTIPVMPYMMTKFLGHLGDKVSFKRYLMLRVLPLPGNRVQQVVDEPLPKAYNNVL
uniref:SWR1-complex protein 5 n=1 Tax=Talaromyces marneffei PM1 TaxID=1077442 RepID=A0A093XF60_TALMA